MILFGLNFNIKIFRWCEGVSWVLSLQSYMFGDSQEAVEVEARGEEEEEDLGEVNKGKPLFRSADIFTGCAGASST